ncbi:glycosyltransferase family 2 protein [Rhodohalobacter sp. SW132]|uniref:glycosyltransferase family 2 protein n=1 Tax=Rhodohalobacter sp. SW132 TaxID=2293433 RepID=UPI000E24F19F|nr:glycosyltransferase family 2 protein [Rhodohalobacter sp. SW132]REL33602.1 glycosyltransferase family 2 protein [Rhodohalobacter sp. SW132]
MNNSFSIIIVSWNGLHYLKEFLPSVAESEYENFEIILADNSSNDGSAEWINRECPQCKVVKFDQNYGYCGGNNRAVPYATGDILIFLNNDVRVDPHWLKHLNRSFADPQTAIVQPKILSHENPEYFEYAGAAGGMIDRLGYPFCRGRLFENTELDTGQYDDDAPIFWASGAALAIRKEVFNDLGGFDEDFEFHMEEIDLCWRAWRDGYTTRFQHKSVVYHLGGGSMPMGSPRKVYYNYRNSLIMLTKNLNSSLFITIFIRLCLDGVAGIRSILSLNPKETLAIIRAHFAFYRRLPSSLKKRSAVQKKRSAKNSIQVPIYTNLVIFDFFLKRKTQFSELPADKFGMDID